MRGGASPFDRDMQGKNAVDLYQQWYMEHWKIGIYSHSEGVVPVEDVPLRHRFHLFCMSCMLRCDWRIFKGCSCRCFTWKCRQTNEMAVTYERHPKLVSRPRDGQAEGEAINGSEKFFDTRRMEEGGMSRMGPAEDDLDEMCAHFVRQDPGRERARERAGRNFSQPRAVLSAGLCRFNLREP